MNIVWAPQALHDLAHIRAYIARENATAAKAIVRSIVTYVEKHMRAFPLTGHSGRVRDTLELAVPKLPYVIPYRIRNGRIEILRVYHTSRLWPSRF